jgi:probable phosphoglycerate mutase
VRTLHVVTHPEATHHVGGVVGGVARLADGPLGIRAAAPIAQALRAQVPDAAPVEVFSSDPRRTRQTAGGGGHGAGPVDDPYVPRPKPPARRPTPRP